MLFSKQLTRRTMTFIVSWVEEKVIIYGQWVSFALKNLPNEQAVIVFLTVSSVLHVLNIYYFFQLPIFTEILCVYFFIGSAIWFSDNFLPHCNFSTTAYLAFGL